MSNHSKLSKPESHVDRWAILFIAILVIGAAVFWMGHH